MSADMLLGIILLVIFAAPMLIVSVVLLSGRGGSLLSGFSTMSKGERANWNIKKVSRFMGVVLLVFTALIAAAFFSAFAGVLWLLWSALAAAVAGLLGAVIYLNKSGRFRR